MTEEEDNESISEDVYEMAEQMAETMERSSRGVITKKQALASILFHGHGEEGVSFIREDYSVEQIAESMGISESTVYSHVSKGMNKLAGAKLLTEIIEEEPWWSK